MVQFDDRGQSIQVGAMLLFGILVIAFSMYHGMVVPEEMQTEEFEHNQEALGDLNRLSDETRSVSRTGVPSTQTVSFGTSYQTWTAYSPTPMHSQMATTDTKEVTIDGLAVTDNAESNEYWSGEKTFDTRFLKYSPRYSHYDTAPETQIEHGFMYNIFSDTQILENGALFGDQSVNLLLLGEEFQETSTKSESVSLTPISTSDKFLIVESDFTITLPTEASEEIWADVLDESSIVDTYNHRGTEIEIQIDSSQPIQFRLTKVGVGDADRTDARYLTTNDLTVQNEATVIVKDKYGNPVSGVPVTLDGTGDQYYSDSEGVARIPTPDEDEMTASIGPNAEEQVTFDITDGQTDDDDGPPTGPGGPDVTIQNLNDNSFFAGVNYQVRYQAQIDVDGNNIDTIQAELVLDGTVVDTWSRNYNNRDQVTANADLKDNQGTYNDEYTIRVTATDDDGTTVIEEEDQANGNNFF